MLKKKVKSYKEQDPLKVQAYLDQIKDIQKEDLVYIDETGVAPNDAFEMDVWTKKGNKIKIAMQGKRGKRQNIIAAKTHGGITSQMIFEGSCNLKVFEEYVDKILCPTLRKGQAVIMDNASFHKSNRIKELIEGCGCKLIYLAPYSPEHNPIEKYWAVLKKMIKKIFKKTNDITNTITEALDLTRNFGVS